MKRWETLAAKDDPETWSDLLNFWPTPRGTYEVSDGWDGGTAKTATGETTATNVIHAFVGAGLTGPRAYVFTSAINWEYSGGSLTNRTNALGGIVHACQFGTSTIGVRGAAASTVVSTGGNFAALGGSPPNAEMCAVADNVVGFFNTSVSVDGWNTSDLNDATVTTPAASNKAATGRLLGQAQGPITAVTTLGKDFIVFKKTGIYRGTYVGGTEKWLFDIVNGQYGCRSKYAAADCGGKVVFVGPDSAQETATDFYPIFYVFDGLNVERLNPMTEFNNGGTADGSNEYCLTYEPRRDLLIASTQGAAPAISGNPGSVVGVYSFRTGQWGRLNKPTKSTIFLGDAGARNAFFGTNSALPAVAKVSAADQITIYLSEVVDSSTHATDPYIQGPFVGQFGAKAKASRVTPALRSRTDLGSGSLSVTVDAFRERHDTTADSTTGAITESTFRKRFDFTKTDNYLRAKLTATDVHLEIDDLVFDAGQAGKN